MQQLIHARTEAEMAQDAQKTWLPWLSREYLYITLDAIKDSVISLDLQGNITRMNKEAGRICAVDPEQAIGHITDVYAARPKSPSDDEVMQRLRKGAAARLVFMSNAEDSGLQLEEQSAAIRDPAGKRSGMY